MNPIESSYLPLNPNFFTGKPWKKRPLSWSKILALPKFHLSLHGCWRWRLFNLVSWSHEAAILYAMNRSQDILDILWYLMCDAMSTLIRYVQNYLQSISNPIFRFFRSHSSKLLQQLIGNTCWELLQCQVIQVIGVELERLLPWHPAVGPSWALGWVAAKIPTSLWRNGWFQRINGINLPPNHEFHGISSFPDER